MRTPNDLVYGERNRYAFYLFFVVRCSIRFWFKVTRMDVSRLRFKACRMLHDLDARGKRNWISKVRSTLYAYGFGDVWLNQGDGGMNQLLHAVRNGKNGIAMLRTAKDSVFIKHFAQFMIKKPTVSVVRY